MSHTALFILPSYPEQHQPEAVSYYEIRLFPLRKQHDKFFKTAAKLRVLITTRFYGWNNIL